MELPRELLNYIADSLEAGEKCYIHKTTKEVITFPEDFFSNELDDPELDLPWKKEKDKVESDSENYVEIENMPSFRSYEVMEEFVNSLPSSIIKVRLLNAIVGKKPFARFKGQISYCGYERDLWFAFRREKNIEWVKQCLELFLK